MIVPISLPEGARIVVKKGDQVDFQTPLLEEDNDQTIKVAVAQEIGVPADKIFNYLAKFVGEEVKKGEILAVKRNFFSEKKCLAEQAGTVREVNHQDGSLLIKLATNRKKHRLSFFKGLIKKVTNNILEVEIADGLSFPLRTANRLFGGPLFHLKETKKNKTLAKEDIENKIIVAQKLDAYSLVKFSTLGAKGYVLENKTGLDPDLNYGLIKKVDDLHKIFVYNRKYCLILNDKKELIIYD